jgi:hypothetical protein
MTTQTIVPIGAFSSIFSVVGIIYLIVCLIIIVCRGVKGWSFVLGLAVLGIFYIDSQTPDIYKTFIKGNGNPDYAPYIYHDGQWKNQHEMNINNIPYGDRYIGWDINVPKRYKMHVDGLDPRLYHPDCLWWSPVTACGIGLICSPFWMMVIYLWATLTSKNGY